MKKLNFSANIRSFMDKNSSVAKSENELLRLIDSFSCPQHPEVEHFLKHNAIDFTKKNQSVTYLVLQTQNSKFTLMGYFSLTIKPISVRASTISKTMGRKLSRVSALNPESGAYTASAYLIAQLGKNFAWPKEERIKGAELLALASQRIAKTQYDLGGVVEFLECENNPFLLDFYAQNGFIAFDRRITAPMPGEDAHELVQLLRFI